MINQNYSYLLLAILITLCSCKTEVANHIPSKHPDISQGKYDKYLGLLVDAYEKNDQFTAALQLSNLKADTKLTYETLNTGLKNNPDNCDKVYEWYWLYDRHNFGVNLVKLDTLLFKKSVAYCDQLNKDNSYAKYAVMKDEEEEHAEASKEKEDSTKFNQALVAKLEQIQLADQDVRKRYLAKNISEAAKDKFRKEMQLVDSLNLIKIDAIFKEHGYPSRELVGKDCNFTPALVIHHSKDLATRYKYLPFLEKAVEDGLLYEGSLDMIKTRIANMELDAK